MIFYSLEESIKVDDLRYRFSENFAICPRSSFILEPLVFFRYPFGVVQLIVRFHIKIILPLLFE